MSFYLEMRLIVMPQGFIGWPALSKMVNGSSKQQSQINRCVAILLHKSHQQGFQRETLITCFLCLLPHKEFKKVETHFLVILLNMHVCILYTPVQKDYREKEQMLVAFECVLNY